MTYAAPVLVLVLCVVCCVFAGKECLLLCGVSDDRCTGFSLVRWLFGGCMVGFTNNVVGDFFCAIVVVILGCLALSLTHLLSGRWVGR